MRIGSVSMTPYVYNTNAVSAKSMNKIDAIGSDVTKSKINASELVSDEAKKLQNSNPLKPGQSLDFTGILQMQMQMSRLNEARVMKPVEDEEQAKESVKIVPTENKGIEAMQNDSVAGSLINLLG